MTLKLLILDLDETLVYSTAKRLSYPEDFRAGEYFVYKRPGLAHFLSFVQEHFDLAVWTSSGAVYASHIVGGIFPDSTALKFVWSRDRCVRKYDPDTRCYYSIKDLRKVKRLGYPLENILVIDDSPEKLERNYGNHIRISAFEGDVNDTELSLLTDYLRSLKNVASVRTIDKRHWRTPLDPSSGLTNRSG